MMSRKNDIHTEIEELLSQKNSLWGDELDRVNKHLDMCEQCREFASFIREIEQREWNPHPVDSMTAGQKQEVLEMIELKKNKSVGPVVRNVPRLGRILASIAVVLVIAAVSFLFFNPSPDELIW